MPIQVKKTGYSREKNGAVPPHQYQTTQFILAAWIILSMRLTLRLVKKNGDLKQKIMYFHLQRYRMGLLILVIMMVIFMH
jgi:hypothetical protein